MISIINYSDAQNSYRRHFIIAYDVSTPFLLSLQKTPEYYNCLMKLFTNRDITSFYDAYENNILIEKKNKTPFFDKERDEITFLHFNIAEEEFYPLRKLLNNKSQAYSSFLHTFIKNKNYNWSSYKQSHKGDVSVMDYLDEIMKIRPSYSSFGNGVSMSNIVYPLILECLNTNTYAEEYILILLSDFLTGSELGNKKDIYRIKDVFRVPYTQSSPIIDTIKEEINYISSFFYKINFFEYVFLPYNSLNPIAIIGYKIKPKVGPKIPENYTLFVDGDLELTQNEYLSSSFNMSPIQLKFLHSNNLSIQYIKMTIYLKNLYDEIIFNDTIVYRTPTGNWQSKYIKDSQHVMKLDTFNFTYYIAPLSLNFNLLKKNILDKLQQKYSTDKLTIKYEIACKYILPNRNPINYLYTTEKSLSFNNIYFASEPKIYIMIYTVITILFIILIIQIIMLGKPINLSIRVMSFLDTYQKINFRENKNITLPYLYPDSNGEIYMGVKGEINFLFNKYPLNWKPTLKFKVIPKELPNVDVYLEYENRWFAPEYFLSIGYDELNNRSFDFRIRITMHDQIINDPQLLSFSISGYAETYILGIPFYIRREIDCQFFIGENLGNTWVALDPGTSGSCLSIGSRPDNIVLYEEYNTKVIPSIIAINQRENIQSMDDLVNNFRYGVEADAIQGQDYVKYRSIKKLLGYKDEYSLRFPNGKEFCLRGRDLVSIMIKKIYESAINRFQENAQLVNQLANNGVLNPKRAIVAVPNSFTFIKIQEMIDAVKRAYSFQEIRYIYESEAVLCYCLKNNMINEGNILIFDMGGATINVTVANIKRETINNTIYYNINILSKIGYAIGGDSIDYCLMKIIGEQIGVAFEQLKQINISNYKNQIRQYYNHSNHNLLNAVVLKNDLQRINNHININVDHLNELFIRNENGTYPILEHAILNDIIYKNIASSIKDALQISGVNSLEKIIVAGRGSMFPKIKKIILQEIENSRIDMNNDALRELYGDIAKIAVSEGACWYAVNRNAVQLNNTKSYSSYIFKHTQDITQIDYHSLISIGEKFDKESIKKEKDIQSAFHLDGHQITFYQVMSNDINLNLDIKNSHKFSIIVAIPIQVETSKIKMQLYKNDTINIEVHLSNGQIIKETANTTELEIRSSHGEHNTWILNLDLN